MNASVYGLFSSVPAGLIVASYPEGIHFHTTDGRGTFTQTNVLSDICVCKKNTDAIHSFRDSGFVRGNLKLCGADFRKTLVPRDELDGVFTEEALSKYVSEPLSSEEVILEDDEMKRYFIVYRWYWGKGPNVVVSGDIQLW